MSRRRSVVQTLAKRIRELREAQRLSQAELARAAGLVPSLVNKLERGAQAARIVTVEAVADALGVSVSELLSTETKTNPRPDRADRLVERIRGLSDDAIAAVEHVVDAMIALKGRRS